MTRPSTAAPIVAAIAMVLVSVGAAYVCGYYCLGGYDSISGPWLIVHRTYPQRWQADFFRPAGRIEQILTGNPVEVFHEEYP